MRESKPKYSKGTQLLRHGRCSIPNQIYHVTTCTQQRKPWFADFTLGRIVVRSIAGEDKSGRTYTLALVVMPDHLHWLVQLTGAGSLSGAVNNVKAVSARAINRRQGQSGRIWQKGFYDRAVRRDEDVAAIARYMIANPLRAGIVRRVGEYGLWDAVCV